MPRTFVSGASFLVRQGGSLDAGSHNTRIRRAGAFCGPLCAQLALACIHAAAIPSHRAGCTGALAWPLMRRFVPDEAWCTCGENRGPARPQTATTTVKLTRQPTPTTVCTPGLGHGESVSFEGTSPPQSSNSAGSGPRLSPRAPRRATAISAARQRDASAGFDGFREHGRES